MDYDDEAKEAAAEALKNSQLDDFDCPSCSANNPCDPPLTHGDEALCNYCGTEFEVKIQDGKVRFRET